MTCCFIMIDKHKCNKMSIFFVYKINYFERIVPLQRNLIIPWKIFPSKRFILLLSFWRPFVIIPFVIPSLCYPFRVFDSDLCSNIKSQITSVSSWKGGGSCFSKKTFLQFMKFPEEIKYVRSGNNLLYRKIFFLKCKESELWVDIIHCIESSDMEN